MALLERAEQLAILVDQFRQAGDAGRLVLISGEAGAGKSSLVTEFLEQGVDRGRILVGRCDDLFAPRPLATV